MKVAVTLVLFCLVSCSKDPALFKITNLNNDVIVCFGHAGMGSKSIYPANSFQSLSECLYHGADGTEMDIQVTKDSVLVIMHDELLSDNTSCSGIIKDLNWSDISGCKLHSFLYNLDLISFDDFIQKIPNPNNYGYTFDCKSRIGAEGRDDYYKLFARTILKTISKYNLQQNILIENSDSDFLTDIKDMNADAKLCFITDDFSSGFEMAKASGFYGLSIDNKFITEEQVTLAHDNNLRVTLYGVVTEGENYSAVSKSPDYIQTDNLDYLLKIFGKYNREKLTLFSNIK